MSYMTWIVNRFNDISGWFYDLYLDCFYAGWPLNVLEDWFLYLSGTFSNLAWNFSSYFSWLLTKIAEIDKILSWDIIWSYILEKFPKLEELRDWFNDWWNFIKSKVIDWWAETSTTVLGWIDVVYDWAMTWIDYLQGQLNSFVAIWNDFINITLPQVTSQLDNLLASWNSFITTTLPQLPNWLDINELINDTLKIWFPFYDSLARLWNSIAEFFTDPEDWLYKSLDRIVERFW